MRWETRELGRADQDALPGLQDLATLGAPPPQIAFDGLVAHPVLARSILNRVPDSSKMFAGCWTINPYRGCSHACTYCFARASHRYLDFDTGHDFDTQVVVKTNAVEQLRRDLARHRSEIPKVMLGSNTDPYQRAEGRFRLMPGILDALDQARVPFSLLTKGTLVRRDLDQIADIATRVRVSIAMSIPILEEDLREQIEPGTPTAHARLETITLMRRKGLRPGVFLMPILPYLTDSAAVLRQTLGAYRQAGAVRVVHAPLHLRAHVKDWFLARLGDTHPDLVPRYRELYGRGAYVPASYSRSLEDRLVPLLREFRFRD